VSQPSRHADCLGHGRSTADVTAGWAPNPGARPAPAPTACITSTAASYPRRGAAMAGGLNTAAVLVYLYICVPSSRPAGESVSAMSRRPRRAPLLAATSCFRRFPTRSCVLVVHQYVQCTRPRRTRRCTLQTRSAATRSTAVSHPDTQHAARCTYRQARALPVLAGVRATLDPLPTTETGYGRGRTRTLVGPDQTAGRPITVFAVARCGSCVAVQH
jgi:hypothetical protein